MDLIQKTYLKSLGLISVPSVQYALKYVISMILEPRYGRLQSAMIFLQFLPPIKYSNIPIL